MLFVFKALKHLKRIRGSKWDVFGQSHERQQERVLIENYLRMIETVIEGLKLSNHESAVALASVPDEIRGFGHVKAKSIQHAELLYAKHLEAFHRLTSKIIQIHETVEVGI